MNHPLSVELEDQLLNDFAIRSFRDIADGDYITARLAFRARLNTQFLWASQQAAEKYLKCILLLNRIPATRVNHDLAKALSLIETSNRLELKLSDSTREFLDRLDSIGRFRYLEVSNSVQGDHLRRLDWLVWDLRKYCTLDVAAHTLTVEPGCRPPLVRLPGGYLEKVIDSDQADERTPLIWRNGFFGRRTRQRILVARGFSVINAPLSLRPQILDRVLQYVYLPRDVVAAYRQHAATK